MNVATLGVGLGLSPNAISDLQKQIVGRGAALRVSVPVSFATPNLNALRASLISATANLAVPINVVVNPASVNAALQALSRLSPTISPTFAVAPGAISGLQRALQQAVSQAGLRVTIDVGINQASIAGLVQQIQQLQQQINSLLSGGNTGGGGSGSGSPLQNQIRALANEASGLRNQFQATGQMSAAMRQRLEEIRDTALRMARSVQAGSAEFRQLTLVAAQAERTLNGLQGQMTRLGIGNQILMGLRASFAGLASAAGGLLTTIGPVAAGLLGLGVGLKQSVGAAASLEDALKGAQTVLEATDGDIETLKKQALELGPAFGVGLTQIAKAAEELGASGLSAKQVVEGGTAAVIAFGKATNTDMLTAVNSIAQATTNFKVQAEDIGRVSDILVLAANKTRLSARDVADGIGQGGAVFADYASNIEDSVERFNQFIGVLSLVREKTNSAADAGTSLKSFLLALRNPTNEAIGLMKAYNLEFYNLDGSRKTIAEVAGELEKLAGVSQKQRDTVLTALFGSDGVRSALALLEAGRKGVESNIQSLGAVGAATEQAKSRTDSYVQAVAKLNASVEALKVRLGDQLLPALTGFVDGAAKALQNADQLGATLKTVGTAAAAAAAAFLAPTGVNAAVLALQTAVARGTLSIAGLTTALGSLRVAAAAAITSVNVLSAVTAALTAGSILAADYANNTAKITDEAEKAGIALDQNIARRIRELSSSSNEIERLSGRLLQLRQNIEMLRGIPGMERTQEQNQSLRNLQIEYEALRKRVQELTDAQSRASAAVQQTTSQAATQSKTFAQLVAEAKRLNDAQQAALKAGNAEAYKKATAALEAFKTANTDGALALQFATGQIKQNTSAWEELQKRLRLDALREQLKGYTNAQLQAAIAEANRARNAELLPILLAEQTRRTDQARRSSEEWAKAINSISFDRYRSSLQNATDAQLQSAKARAEEARDAERYVAIVDEITRREEARAKKRAEALEQQREAALAEKDGVKLAEQFKARLSDLELQYKSNAISTQEYHDRVYELQQQIAVARNRFKETSDGGKALAEAFGDVRAKTVDLRNDLIQMNAKGYGDWVAVLKRDLDNGKISQEEFAGALRVVLRDLEGQASKFKEGTPAREAYNAQIKAIKDTLVELQQAIDATNLERLNAAIAAFKDQKLNENIGINADFNASIASAIVQINKLVEEASQAGDEQVFAGLITQASQLGQQLRASLSDVRLDKALRPDIDAALGVLGEFEERLSERQAYQALEKNLATTANFFGLTVNAVQRTEGAFSDLEDALAKLSRAGVEVSEDFRRYLAERFPKAAEAAQDAFVDFARYANEIAADLADSFNLSDGIKQTGEAFEKLKSQFDAGSISTEDFIEQAGRLKGDLEGLQRILEQEGDTAGAQAVAGIVEAIAAQMALAAEAGLDAIRALNPQLDVAVDVQIEDTSEGVAGLLEQLQAAFDGIDLAGGLQNVSGEIFAQAEGIVQGLEARFESLPAGTQQLVALFLGQWQNYLKAFGDATGAALQEEGEQAKERAKALGAGADAALVVIQDAAKQVNAFLKDATEESLQELSKLLPVLESQALALEDGDEQAKRYAEQMRGLADVIRRLLAVTELQKIKQQEANDETEKAKKLSGELADAFGQAAKQFEKLEGPAAEAMARLTALLEQAVRQDWPAAISELGELLAFAIGQEEDPATQAMASMVSTLANTIAAGLTGGPVMAAVTFVIGLVQGLIGIFQRAKKAAEELAKNNADSFARASERFLDAEEKKYERLYRNGEISFEEYNRRLTEIALKRLAYEEDAEKARIEKLYREGKLSYEAYQAELAAIDAYYDERRAEIEQTAADRAEEQRKKALEEQKRLVQEAMSFFSGLGSLIDQALAGEISLQEFGKKFDEEVRRAINRAVANAILEAAITAAGLAPLIEAFKDALARGDAAAAADIMQQIAAASAVAQDTAKQWIQYFQDVQAGRNATPPPIPPPSSAPPPPPGGEGEGQQGKGAPEGSTTTQPTDKAREGGDDGKNTNDPVADQGQKELKNLTDLLNANASKQAESIEVFRQSVERFGVEVGRFSSGVVVFERATANTVVAARILEEAANDFARAGRSQTDFGGVR